MILKVLEEILIIMFNMVSRAKKPEGWVLDINLDKKTIWACQMPSFHYQHQQFVY